MSQVIVLDTHIWFWLATQDWNKFPAAWRDEIEMAEQVGISPISCYEIVLAQERGRLELPCAPEDWFRDALEPMDIILLPKGGRKAPPFKAGDERCCGFSRREAIAGL